MGGFCSILLGNAPAVPSVGASDVIGVRRGMARRPRLWAELGLNLALLTVAVSLLDVLVFYIANRVVLTEATTDLAEQAAVVIAGQLATTAEVDWRRIVEQHRRSGVDTITVYGTTGRVVAGAEVEASSAVQSVFVTREVTTESTDTGIRVLAPVGSPGRPTAVVALELEARALAQPAWVAAGVHAAISGAVIVGFGLFLLRRSVLTPLSAMRVTTQHIAGGAFGAQVSEDAPAELADLAQALNRMSDALHDYRNRTADQMARLEEANVDLTRAQEALVRSEKLASVGRLAAGLAHELGNPLAAVRGYVELLSMGGLTEPQGSELVTRSRVEVERMHGLLRNLLDFARNDAPTVAPIDVGSLVTEATATVRHQLAFRALTVDTAVDGTPVIAGDAGKLHQALVNLLLNAAESGAHHIRLTADDADGVRITCADDGCGIAPEALGRIFEPFYTTRPPGSGTGLGLAIVHRIVDQHGGYIEVDSSVGQGTRFSLRWPPPTPGAPS